MLRKFIIPLLFAFCALPASADEPFILRQEPPVYRGGMEQLRSDLARQTAMELVRRAERDIRARRRAAYPKGVARPYASVYVDTPTLRRELGGWFMEEHPLSGRVVIGLTVSERGKVAEARVLSSPSEELGEAVCAGAVHTRPWLPGKRLVNHEWAPAPFRYNVMLPVSRVREALEELLRARAQEELRREWMQEKLHLDRAQREKENEKN